MTQYFLKKHRMSGHAQYSCVLRKRAEEHVTTQLISSALVLWEVFIALTRISKIPDGLKKHTPRSTCSCSTLSGCCSRRRSPFRATEPASVVKNGLLSSERPIGPVRSGMRFDGSFRSLLSMPDVTHLHGQLKAPSCQSMKQSGLRHWTRKR